ncbi:MAG: hypothetical protein ACTSP3_02445 [Candidatus Heimdallarchaeaceae archaeon]
MKVFKELKREENNLLVVLSIRNHLFIWENDYVSHKFSWFSSRSWDLMRVCFKLKTEDIDNKIKESLIFNNQIISVLGIILGTNPFSIGIDLFHKRQDRYEHIFHRPIEKEEKDLATLLPQSEKEDSMKWIKDILDKNWGYHSESISNLLAAIQSANFTNRIETMFMWSWWGLEWFFSKVGRDQILNYTLPNSAQKKYNIRKYLKRIIIKVVEDLETEFT